MKVIVNAMMKTKEEIIDSVLSSLPDNLHVSSGRIWCDYDDKADVLYISLRRPQCADQSEMDDDVIIHYSGEQIVGITVINASNRERLHR